MFCPLLSLFVFLATKVPGVKTLLRFHFCQDTVPGSYFISIFSLVVILPGHPASFSLHQAVIPFTYHAITFVENLYLKHRVIMSSIEHIIP